ncbi:hypothetical protein ACSN7O_004765, partial [Enterobacter chuandaensis]
MSSFFSGLHSDTPVITAPFRTLSFLCSSEVAVRLLVTRTYADPMMRTARAFGARPLVSSSGEPVADAVTVSGLSDQPVIPWGRCSSATCTIRMTRPGTS